MADESDMASAQEEMTLQRALAAQAARSAMAPSLVAVGFCHNIKCGEEFPQGDSRIFCDSRCAVEYQRFQKT